MFAISETIDGVAYTISADDFGSFVANLHEVGGLYGLKFAVDEAHGTIAERAVDPIAKPDTGEAESHAEPNDELADLIRQAPDERALAALWRAHKATWNGDYNRIAEKRKTQLRKVAK